jgi:hypothetical protein
MAPTRRSWSQTVADRAGRVRGIARKLVARATSQEGGDVKKL